MVYAAISVEFAVELAFELVVVATLAVVMAMLTCGGYGNGEIVWKQYILDVYEVLALARSREVEIMTININRTHTITSVMIILFRIYCLLCMFTKNS